MKSLLYGHITIPKSLPISKLIYNTSVLTFPTKFTALVNQAIIIHNFVWNKKAKIKHRIYNDRAKRAWTARHAEFQIISEALKVVLVKEDLVTVMEEVGVISLFLTYNQLVVSFFCNVILT